MEGIMSNTRTMSATDSVALSIIPLDVERVEQLASQSALRVEGTTRYVVCPTDASPAEGTAVARMLLGVEHVEFSHLSRGAWPVYVERRDAWAGAR
jgi:hypothetical protein